jgi:hypothetical protein
VAGTAAWGLDAAFNAERPWMRVMSTLAGVVATLSGIGMGVHLLAGIAPPWLITATGWGLFAAGGFTLGKAIQMTMREMKAAEEIEIAFTPEKPKAKKATRKAHTTRKPRGKVVVTANVPAETAQEIMDVLKDQPGAIVDTESDKAIVEQLQEFTASQEVSEETTAAVTEALEAIVQTDETDPVEQVSREAVVAALGAIAERQGVDPGELADSFAVEAAEALAEAEAELATAGTVPVGAAPAPRPQQGKKKNRR